MSLATAPADLSASAMFKKPIPSLNTLKRNTACHQCRRRKLKCDAQRPCSTCLRSHAYALSRAPPGVQFPAHPECTFDDLENEVPPTKSKYERLETRIAELEGLLRDMGSTTQSARGNSDGSSTAASVRSSPEAEINVQSSPLSTHSQHSASAGSSSMNASPHTTTNLLADTSQHHTPSPPQVQHDLLGTSPISHTVLPPELRDPTFIQDIISPASKIALLTGTEGNNDNNNNNYEIFPMNWPAGLPGPGITRHLVQAFFAFYIYAGRLFHGPTFMSTLDLHPNDARFPSPCVLHAMCAIGSMYTAEIPATPIHTDGIFPYEIFAGRWRRAQTRPDSFAEQQVKLAKICIEDLLDTGTDLIEVLQAMVLLASFYKCQGRWSEAYLTACLALNCSVPCGLTIRPPFTTGTPSYGLAQVRQSTVLAPARSTIEDELRINIFWIAYGLERQQVSGNSYSSMICDEDIYQLLPVSGDKFESGVPVRVEDRQWCHDADVLLTHPKNGTDSFTLFVKAMLLLSHVKRFNVRYKGRFHAGDPDMASPHGIVFASMDEMDPRDTKAFREVDRLVTGFGASWPPHLRNPIQDETIDSYLYTACCSMHLAVILLHEPYADLDSPICPSSGKLLTAARGIMDLLYGVASTSYDVSLLDFLPFLAWFNTGRVLIRYLKAALDINRYDLVAPLQMEISFIHSMLGKAGERMPAAYRYKKILYDLLGQLCGMQFVEPGATQQGKGSYVDPSQAPYVDPMPVTCMMTATTAAQQQMDLDAFDFSQLL